MTKFDRNNKSFIQKEIQEKVKLPRIGVVTQVFEHSSENDDSNWEVEVQFNGGVSQEDRIPFHSPTSESISPPKNGDKVLVIYTDGHTNKPVALSTAWSNKDRPPVGKAGMYRNEFESGLSAAGEGNLYINGYTKYNKSVASYDKRNLNPEETFVQIAKNPSSQNVDPSTKPDLPAKIEMYDSAKSGDSWISVEINKEGGSDSDATWGMKFNIKTGEWKLVGPKGFGITSDGNGNFVWKHKEIVYDEIAGENGGLSL